MIEPMERINGLISYADQLNQFMDNASLDAEATIENKFLRVCDEIEIELGIEPDRNKQ